MKTYSALFMLVLLLSVAGCKKEKEDTPDSPAVAKLKTRAYAGLNASVMFTYDAQGRLVKESSTTTSDHTDYTYSTATVIVSHYNSSGVVDNSTTYFLNSQGLADSASSNDYYERYYYDADGYLIRLAAYDDANTLTGYRYYFYENGNRVTMYNVDPADHVRQQFTFYYDTEHLNTTGSHNTGMTFLGRDSKNVFTRLTDTAPPNYANITDYVYSFDSEGRTVSMSVFSPEPGNVVSYSYY